MDLKAEKTSFWHKVFEGFLVLKGFNGVWETITGILFLTVSKEYFHHVFFFLTRWELLEDPHDRFLRLLTSSFASFTSAKAIVGIYILAHGILNVFLVIQLARNRHWAYLVTMGFSGIFLVYQVYRILLHHSYGLIIISAADIFFLWLTWKEYQFHVRKQPEA